MTDLFEVSSAGFVTNVSANLPELFCGERSESTAYPSAPSTAGLQYSVGLVWHLVDQKHQRMN